MTNNADETYVNAWKLAVDSSIQHLKKKSTVGNYTYIADFNGDQIVYVGSHLECFHAGNWLLGGKLLNNDTIVEIALEMNEGTLHIAPRYIFLAEYRASLLEHVQQHAHWHWS